MKTRKPRTVYRSAITGRFVSKAYADADPDTTVAHTIKPKQKANAQ